MSEEEKREETKYNKIEQKPVEDQDEEQEIEEVKEKKEPIVNEPVKKRKKGLMERLVGGLAGPDGARGIGQYVKEDIVVPAIKNIIADSITSGINMMMFGEQGRPTNTRNSNARYQGNVGGRTNYNKVYRGPSKSDYYGRNEPPTRKPVPRGGTVEDYVIDNRHDALAVLDRLQADAEMYGVVSLADYYDLVGVETAYTHNEWGWDEQMLQINLRPVRGGYIIPLPQPIHLD